MSPPYSTALRRVPPPRITIACADFARSKSSGGASSTRRCSATATTGIEISSSNATPPPATHRPTRGWRPASSEPGSGKQQRPGWRQHQCLHDRLHPDHVDHRGPRRPPPACRAARRGGRPRGTRTAARSARLLQQFEQVPRRNRIGDAAGVGQRGFLRPLDEHHVDDAENLPRTRGRRSDCRCCRDRRSRRAGRC